MKAFNRRQFIAALVATRNFMLPHSSKASQAPSYVEATLDASPAASRMARKTWQSPPNCYFAYPHNNGFIPATGNPVIAQRGDKYVTLLEWDFRAGTSRPILHTAIGNMYYDIAEATGDLFLIDGRQRIISVPTMGHRGNPREFKIHHESAERMEDLLSVSRDGMRVLYALAKTEVGRKEVRAARVMELDVRTGAVSLVCDMPFDADHQQYCPHDESWVGFAHEGDISGSLDRVWGLHRGIPDGVARPLWHEKAAGSGVLLAGHERWAFHQTGALVVAYPESTGRPRGLYFVDPVAGVTSLVSASNYDWHCNISRSGKWAVVDTKTPKTRPREADGRRISEIVLVDMKTGQREWLVRSHPDAGHPWHPHPHFTPDEKYVLYNDLANLDSTSRLRTVAAIRISP